MEYLYIGVCLLLGIMGLMGILVQLYLYISYHRSNRMKTESGKPAHMVAREALDRLGMQNVEVKKASFLWAFIWGNSYSKKRKTVYLRRGIYDRSTVTAVSVACQKVGLAEMDKQNDKSFNSRYWLAPFAVLGVESVPMILLAGFAFDIAIKNAIGIYSILFAVIALVVFICSMAFTFMQIPIEKKAVDFGTQVMKMNNFLNVEETEVAQKYYKAYILDFKMQFIIKLLEVIKFILRIVVEVAKNKD